MADWLIDVAKTVVAAALGTGGVTLWLARRKRADDGVYLSIRLAVILEEYSRKCAELIDANINAQHHPDEQFPNWDLSLPQLGVFPEDGEGWKALNVELATACLELPNRIAATQAALNRRYERNEDEADDLIGEAAAELGCLAWNIAGKLRYAGRLPKNLSSHSYLDTLGTWRMNYADKRKRQQEYSEKLQQVTGVQISTELSDPQAVAIARSALDSLNPKKR